MSDPDRNTIIERTKVFVRQTLKGAEGGYKWSHVERVYRTSMHIVQQESVDDLVVALGALLHDIADAKFYNRDESLGPKTVREFLEDQQVNSEVI